MSTLVTPSAKAHERVTGRWMRDIEVATQRDWIVYYTKHVLGTPIPWLMSAYACLILFSRAGLEVAAWTCVSLTFAYIVIDRQSRTREFSFFRVGADFFLLGYLLVALLGALLSDSFSLAIDTLGSARWVFLLYGLTYCWELFPGMNRVYFLMIAACSGISVYSIWQHFTGLDLARGVALSYAPVTGQAYFVSSGFFSSPEILGTILAMLIPFPAAAFLFGDRINRSLQRWLPVALVLIFSIANLWTYRPGLWMAAFAGLIVTLLAKSRGAMTLLGSLVVTLIVTLWVTYGSTGKMFDQVQQAEVIRAEKQRAQINTQVTLWGQSPWFGVGSKATHAANYDPGSGNVYFQVLAQSGALGAAFYLLFILSFLLATYRILQELPQTHYWHQVLVSGSLGSQIAFHLAGLHWGTISESLTMYLYIFLLASTSYLMEHYHRGLVPDDFVL
jgi:hypothetical protein